MNKELLLKKLKKFKKYIEEFVKHKKYNIKDVHKLRVKSRELSSLLSDDDIFYKKCKKVIKLSNKIRDIDVFFEVYLHSLPEKYITRLDLEFIVDSAKKYRKKMINKLHFYLKYLEIPNDIEFVDKQNKYYSTSKYEPELIDKEKLHKYRITIKKKLYNELNKSVLDEEKIEILTATKDILGTMNDNINGLNRLQILDIDLKLLSKIKTFTDKQNLKLFIKFKILDEKI